VSVLACRTGLDVPDEPEYNPDLHLALAPPAWLKLLPDYKHAHQAPAGRLAYSAPHSFLSAEGVRVLREIVGRETRELQPSRGNRIALRLPLWP